MEMKYTILRNPTRQTTAATAQIINNCKVNVIIGCKNIQFGITIYRFCSRLLAIIIS